MYLKHQRNEDNLIAPPKSAAVDAGTLDLIRSLGGNVIEWGTIGLIFMSVRKPLLERVPRLRKFGPAQFEEAAAEQNLAQSISLGTLTTSNAVAASPTSEGSEQPPAMKSIQHAEGALPSSLTPETADLVRRLAIGWRFERILRLIFSEQIQLLKAMQNAGSLSESGAAAFYTKTNSDYQKVATFAQFMSFLTGANLVAATTVANGSVFTLSVDGQVFLKYIDAIASGVAFPGISDNPQDYKWGSNPLPKMIGEVPMTTTPP